VLNSTEAIYAFTAWLTTRSTPAVFGHLNDAAEAVELVTKFVAANPDMPDVRSNYPDFFNMPID
jgi:hypothetical protein